MKLMFVSDIHGSEYWLDKALEVYEEGEFDRLVLLGDLLYHGPRNPLPKGYEPQKVLAKLNALSQSLVAIRGNCEAEVDQMVLDFEVLNEQSHILLEDRDFFLCHGHHLYEEHLPKLKDGTVICHGHTHIPRIERIGNCIVFNPGSISLPKMETPPCYGVYEAGELSVISLLDGGIYKQMTLL